MEGMLIATNLAALGFGIVVSSLYFRRRERRVREEVLRESKAASEVAHASETRWRLLFEQSPLSVQIFRPDGQTKRVNASWRKLFHLTEEQGLAFNPLKDPDLIKTGAVNLIRLAFDEGQTVDVPPVPFPVNTDPPQTRWIGGVLYPVKDVEGRVLEVVTVHNDITETKRAEEAMLTLNHTLEERVALRTAELEAARKELNEALLAERELSELKSRFVGMVSHEFRTPLGVTMSAVEVIRHYDEKLSADKRRELCDDIYSATRNMASLMEHVLLLGRVEAGKLGFKPMPLNLVGLIQKIVDEQQSIFEGRCPVHLETEGELDAAVGDEALIRHILGNLISNAVKYSPTGERVTVKIERKGVSAICSIADRGIGIPEKDQAHLFESFNRASNVGDIPGTGLGLVIVKRCVEFHGGSIALVSAAGQGTTFTVVLPVFETNADDLSSLTLGEYI
jgi:PAS domain S-box-containing protein